MSDDQANAAHPNVTAGSSTTGEVDHVLTTTRAVRRRLDLDRPVPIDVVERCIDIALQAPMGANIVRIRWVVVDDAATKQELADLYRDAYADYRENALVRLQAVGRDEHDPSLRSADHLAANLHRVPVLVIPCHVEPLPEATTYSLSIFYGSVLPAVWSFMLALRSRGLGSSFTTLHLQHEERAAALLGIPPTATQLALLPVAYFTGDDFRPTPRKPAAAYTYRNAWGQRLR